jgi:hypothetical protein
MTRGIFERELQSLQECSLALGSEVGDNVVKAVDVLKHRDAWLAWRSRKPTMSMKLDFY